MNLTISAAYRINEHISVGAGPVIDYFNVRLTQALNIGVNQLVGDPVADLHGEDVSAGFNVGGLYQFNDDTRVGLDYRSRITHSINGSQYVSVPQLLGAREPRHRGPAGFPELVRFGPGHAAG